MTATEGIEWAEAYISTRPGQIRAAIIRGNQLWVRTVMNPSGEATELHQFFAEGEQPTNNWEEFRTEVGVVHLIWAWEHEYAPPNFPDRESWEALMDSERKLEVYTDPAQRSAKVLELLRWSALSGSPDFSSD
mgnify:CR=1 FL=1